MQTIFSTSAGETMAALKFDMRSSGWSSTGIVRCLAGVVVAPVKVTRMADLYLGNDLAKRSFQVRA